MDHSGPLFRAIHPQFAREPLSGEGARRHGGRFNRRGRAALYLAIDFDTLRKEIGRGGTFQPSVVVEFAAELSNLFNATDPSELRRFGTIPATLADPAWRMKMLKGQPIPTQELAEELIAAGHPGMLVPSYAPGTAPRSRNVILWSWSDAPPTKLRLVDDEGRLS